MDDKDEAILRQINQKSEQIPPLEELYGCRFSSAKKERNGEWITLMEIFRHVPNNAYYNLVISILST